MSALLPQRLAGELARRSGCAPILLLSLLSACATAPKDAGYSDVEKTVADRTDLWVSWNGHTVSDQFITDAVNLILTQPITATQASQIALVNNRHLQATLENLGIAQADLVQAGLLKNPLLDIGVRFPDRGPSATYLDFAVTEDFLDFLIIPARTRLAASELAEAKATVAHEVMALVAQSSADFYTCQASEMILELQRDLASASAASLETARKLHEAGNITDLAFTQARAQDARAKIDLADAQADANDAREKVNDDLGLVDPQTHWTAEPLPDLPGTEISGRKLESLAFRQREDLFAARENVVVQARTLGLTSDFRFFSQADLGPEFERETDGQWRIGPTLSLPLPLFDQGQAKLSRAQSVLRQSEDRYLALIVDVQSQVRAARAKYFSARAKAALYRDQVLPVQRDLVHQTELQYNGMYVSVFELLEAKHDQVEASRQFIEALRDYWTARAQLEQAIGSRLPSEHATTQPTTQP